LSIAVQLSFSSTIINYPSTIWAENSRVEVLEEASEVETVEDGEDVEVIEVDAEVTEVAVAVAVDAACEVVPKYLYRPIVYPECL
jgi:hypothetical protein